MHHHFHPPHISDAKNAQDWLAAFLMWLAFEPMRHAGEARVAG